MTVSPPLVTQFILDSADLEEIKRLKAKHVTTNPFLIVKEIHKRAVAADIENLAKPEELFKYFSAKFASEILETIEGSLSLQVDPRLKETEALIKGALSLQRAVKNTGADSKRLLIKIPASSEGILAARALEAKKIRCNLSMIFSVPQALAAMKSNITCIAPFVNRLSLWHQNVQQVNFSLSDDPGLRLLRQISQAKAKMKSKTRIMAASISSFKQVEALYGIDLITLKAELYEKAHNERLKLKINSKLLETAPLLFQNPRTTDEALLKVTRESRIINDCLGSLLRDFSDSLQACEEKFLSAKI